MFNLVNMMYGFSMIKVDNVRWYVNHGFLTKDQFKQITGQDFDPQVVNSANNSQATSEAIKSDFVQASPSSSTENQNQQSSSSD